MITVDAIHCNNYDSRCSLTLGVVCRFFSSKLSDRRTPIKM